MKVVHYIKRIRLAEGGVVRASLDTAAAIAVAGVETVLLTTDATDAPPAWREPTVGIPRVVLLPKPRGPVQRLTGPAMRVAMEHAANADAIHLHAIWNFSNAQIAKAAHRAGIPTVLSVHGMLGDWSMSVSQRKKAVFLALFGRALLEDACMVHLTCQDELDQAGKRFMNPRRAVIPLPIDLSPYMPAARKTDNDPPAVLFLSRVHPVKGVDILIHAAALLIRAKTPLRLVIAGPGEAEYITTLRSLARTLGIESSVSFVGPVFGAAKQDLYAQSDIFVLPSEHENFGIVWAEAMASGLPTVVTRGVGPWKEIVLSEGATAAERTAEGLAAALTPLLTNPTMRANFSRNARSWVLNFLNPDSVTPRYIEMYSRAGERPE